MTRLIVAMLSALLIAPLALQADDKKDDAKSDHKLIQGSWKAVERHINGEVRKSDRNVVVQITEGEMLVKVGDREFKLKYELDPTKKPKHMDQMIERDGEWIDPLDMDLDLMAEGEVKLAELVPAQEAAEIVE